MFELKRKADGAVIERWQAVPDRIDLPSNLVVFGAGDGWQNDDYLIESRVYDIPDPTFFTWDYDTGAAPRPIADIKKSLKDRIALERYQLEDAGVIWNGHIAHTDRASRANYLGMVVSNSMGLRVNNSTYKFVDGPAALPNADVTSLAITVAQFIQTLYDKERSFIEQLDALQTLEELSQFTWDFEVTPPSLET